MKSNPANALFQIVAIVLSDPAAHGHPGCLPIGRIQIDFDGYQGRADFIGGDLFRSVSKERNPIASDQAQALLNTKTTHPEGGTKTLGEILDEAIESHLSHRHPGWNHEEGSYGNLDIRFASDPTRSPNSIPNRRKDHPPVQRQSDLEGLRRNYSHSQSFLEDDWGH